MTSEFIKLANQYVKVAAITRVSVEGTVVLGVPGTEYYYVHTSDGGSIAVNKSDYNRVMGIIRPTKPAPKKEKAARG